ncbi:MAG: flagellar biosynthesis anti-sigma factor FlgM [Nitrospirae bacterium]|nr:flagellar biosynthesis anti-sigma factor FlgM [Nitrospirota bacterium]
MIAEINIPDSNGTGKSSVIEKKPDVPYGARGICDISTGSNVQISQRAKEFSHIRNILNRLPEIREDKVNFISNQMLMGAYNVSAEDIASRLISELS